MADNQENNNVNNNENHENNEVHSPENDMTQVRSQADQMAEPTQEEPLEEVEQVIEDENLVEEVELDALADRFMSDFDEKIEENNQEQALETEETVSNDAEQAETEQDALNVNNFDALTVNDLEVAGENNFDALTVNDLEAVSINGTDTLSVNDIDTLTVMDIDSPTVDDMDALTVMDIDAPATNEESKQKEPLEIKEPLPQKEEKSDSKEEPAPKKESVPGQQPNLQNPIMGMQNGRPAGTNNILNTYQASSGQVHIPGMGFVPASKPKVEEKKQPEVKASSQVPKSGMSIPGMRNNTFQAAPKTEEKPLTEEERLTQQLQSKKSYLQILKRGNGGTPSQIRQSMEEINRIEKEIGELNQKLGLEEQEKEETVLSLEEQIKADTEKRKQAQRLELRNSERALADLLRNSPAELDYGSQLRKQQLEKRINNLKASVPENERLPINDEPEPDQESEELDDLLEDAHPVEKENPFAQNIAEPKRNPVNRGKASAFNRELKGVDIETELDDENVIGEADEDDEIDAVYGIEETVRENNEKSSRILLTDFYDRLDRRLKDNEYSKQVTDQLTYLLKEEAGVDPTKASHVADLVHGYASRSMLDAVLTDRHAPKMHNIAPMFFSDAYDSLDDADLSLRDRIITAQKVADLMLWNYSPIAFVNNEFDQYAHNYVLSDNERLQKQLEEKGFESEEIEKLIRSVQAALAGEPEIEEPEVENVPEPQAEPEQKPEQKLELAPEQKPEEQLNDALEDAGFEEEYRLLKEEVDKEFAERKAKIEGQRQDSQMYDGIEEMFTEPVDDGQMYDGIKDLFAEPADKNEISAELREAMAKSADSIHRVALFTDKLASFNSMYGVHINADRFAFSVSESWTLMQSGDAQKKADGQKEMGNLFKSTLQVTFDVEKRTSYNEHRIPEYTEIIKSTNELFRSAMYAFTDLYHDPKSAALFESTAFGGLNAKEMARLTAGDSLWKMDQKSDKAWDIQSREAKELAEQWLKEDQPYEKMINEMNALIEANKNGTLDRQDMYTKLTAAEWLLVNNEKMMVEDPQDPLNPIPNWGNRYWKSIVNAREALGIDRHTSMRDLIQGEYAACAGAANSTHYTEVQVDHFMKDPKERALYDSLEKQKVEFATQCEAISINDLSKEKADEKTANTHENEIRWREPVESENEREKQKNEPKVWSNLVIEKTNELKIDSVREDFR